MERRHFQLDEGYLNIDDKGLYLAPSGNWQEALANPERTVKGRIKRSVYGLFGLVLIMTRGALEFAHVSTNMANGLVLSIGLAGAGVLLLLHRFRHDLAPAYRIPFAKVRSLDVNEGCITVHFVNGDHREDRVNLKVPDQALMMIQEGLERSRG